MSIDPREVQSRFNALNVYSNGRVRRFKVPGSRSKEFEDYLERRGVRAEFEGTNETGYSYIVPTRGSKRKTAAALILLLLTLYAIFYWYSP